ncbi:P-loop NTPase [Membranicola marinus]|uniref:Iron-sulfur cluster carrier protein n=1 Tax=Membranihabitans marinus TaxID=1227546 RepID=A0A953HSK6_9BACT|nr:P-loop NTPase [Membranihabitans marinus]MBY5960173.1 P-loop NTPase [Membranihabitans marinus]
MNEKQIKETLSQIKDPVNGQSIVNTPHLQKLEIGDNEVNIVLAYNNLDPDIKNKLNFTILEALYEIIPEANVNIHFENQAPKPENPYPHIKNIIAVASGKGGVGKSTVAANLAVGLQKKGHSVGLLDADLYGPSIPTMFGLKNKRPRVKEIHGRQLLVPLTAYDIPLMSIGFILDPEQAVVLRGPRLSGVIKQFLNDVLWPELDYLIIDLPPSTGDIQLTMVQTAPITGAVIVTTPQAVAVDDAIKASNMFRLESIDVPIIGVVENMAWFSPIELPENKYYLFGNGGGQKLAAYLEVPLLGQLPLIASVGELADEGKPAWQAEDKILSSYLDNIIERTVYYTQLRNKQSDPTRIVKIKS